MRRSLSIEFLKNRSTEVAPLSEDTAPYRLQRGPHLRRDSSTISTNSADDSPSAKTTSRKAPFDTEPRGTPIDAQGVSSAHPPTTPSKCDVAILACPVVVSLVAGVALCVGLLRFTKKGADGPDMEPNPPKVKTMESVYNALWTAGNNSLDPCTDFYQHVCRNYDSSRQQGIFFHREHAIREVLQGISRTDTARLLFTYYRTCLSAQWETEDSARLAVRALLAVFHVDPKDATPLSMFALIVKLPLAYGIHSTLLIYHNRQGPVPATLPPQLKFRAATAPEDSPPELFLLAMRGLFSSQAREESRTQSYLGTALAEICDMMGVDVTSDHLHDFAAHLHRVIGDADVFEESDMSLLSHVAPGVSARLWKDIVEESTGVRMSQDFFHSPLSVISHHFVVLMNTTLLPVTAVFVICEAAVMLALSNTVETQDPHAYGVFCVNSAYELSPLWLLDTLLSFHANAEHNQAVFSVFNTLTNTIVAELGEILEPAEAAFAERKLRELNIVLPYHVISLELALPKLVENFFLNVLYIRQHRLTRSRYRSSTGYSQILVRALETRLVLRAPGIVSIPLPIYTAIPLEQTLPVLRMALFGFVLADNLWSVLFSINNWTSSSREALERLHCSQPGKDVDLGSFLLVQRPQLALASTIRALNASDWHEHRLYPGGWYSSPSQLFYRLVAFFFYCNDYIYSFTNYSNDQLNEDMYQIPDFFEAFKCSRNRLRPKCPQDKPASDSLTVTQRFTAAVV